MPVYWGAFFSLFMIIGQTMDTTGSLYVLYNGAVQVAKTLTVFAGYTTLFGTIILYLFYTADSVSTLAAAEAPENKLIWKCVLFFEKHPFLCSFVFLCIIYVPYAVLSYPGILQGDATHMIPQGFNLPELQSSRLVLLDENVFLNAHHPVVYTLFIHACLVIGKAIFHSYNIGLFLVSITQLLFAIAVISHMISRMRSVGVNHKVCMGVLLYFGLSPKIAAYMFLISKDVIYAYTVLLLVVEIAYFLYQAVKTTKAAAFGTGKTTLLVTVLSCIAVFFRNEGKYVITIWFVLMALRQKKLRKLIIPALLVSIAAVCFVNQVVLPYYKITPGSKREMLSIPFQQTARYVATCPEEVTEEEKEAIDQVLNYDTLAERYVPTKSDSVKDGWNKYSTGEDLKNYFSVWFQMFKKHPMVYIEATVNNYYNYVYPGKTPTSNYSYWWSETCMADTNTLAESVDMDLHYPSFLNHARNGYERLREKVFNLPILNMFKCTAVYVWILLFLTAFLLWKKNTAVLTIAVLPMLESLGIALLGPCNGEYFRYAYIITVLLPAAIVMGLSGKNK